MVTDGIFCEDWVMLPLSNAFEYTTSWYQKWPKLCPLTPPPPVPEENIATMKHGAQVVKGELKSALLDGDTQNYDLDHGFSRHPIEEDGRAGIQVKLGQPYIVNHVRLLLWDRDSR